MKWRNFEIKCDSPELFLVCMMLFSLVVVVFAVLMIPLSPDARVTNTTDIVTLTNTVLKARTDLLTIIITAFGAWVGAGAAYFFGKENLKTTTQGMLTAFSSPQLKLQSTKIRDISPERIGRLFKLNDFFKDAYDWVINNPKIWFVVIVNDDDSLKSVLHEEAFYRFQLERDRIENKDPNKKNDIIKLSDLIKWVEEKDKDLGDEVSQFSIDIDMDADLGTAQTMMTHKNARLAIIINEKHVPTNFITTGDIRKFILAA